MAQRLDVNDKLCTFCSACEGACPLDLIYLDTGSRILEVDTNNCIFCNDCAIACKFNVFSIVNDTLAPEPDTGGVRR